MKSLWIFVGVFAASVSATLSSEEILQLAMSMPTCGFDCLQKTLLASPCGLLDSSCSCANATITEQTTACVLEACTIKQQLSTKNITETICQRVPQDGDDTPVGAVFVIALAIVAHLLRMASRVTFPTEGGKFGVHFWWDDALISFSVILLLAIAVLSFILTSLGVGKDIWTLPYKNLTQILKVYYPDELLNLTALAVIKISLLLTMLRVFQGSNFRRLAYAAMGLNVAYFIVFVCITAFQCTPVSLAWNRWSGEYPGTCRNLNAQRWAAAAVDIFLDFVLLALPVHELWKIGLNSRQKILLGLMYAVGLFTTATSIVRLALLITSASSVNLTKAQKSSGYWAIIELATGIICVCLPGLRDLLKKRFPELMGSSALPFESSSPPTPSLMHMEDDPEKSGTEVTIHGKTDDDRESIALQDYRQKNSLGEQYSPTSPSFPDQRNFSHPYSPPRRGWRADSTEALNHQNGAVSPV